MTRRTNPEPLSTAAFPDTFAGLPELWGKFTLKFRFWTQYQTRNLLFHSLWYLNLGRGLLERPRWLIWPTTIHCWAAPAFRWNVAAAVPDVRVTADDLSLLLLLMLTVIAPATASPPPRPASPPPCPSCSAPCSPGSPVVAAAAATVSPLHARIIAPRRHLGSQALRKIAVIQVTYQISLL